MYALDTWDLISLYLKIAPGQIRILFNTTLVS